MTSNSTQPNTTESGCDTNWDTVFKYWFYMSVMCSVASFVGNVLIILIICRIKTLRTTTNLFIVNMAISDVFVPVLDAVNLALIFGNDILASTTTLRTVLCKTVPFLFNTSYGVSMSSLAVITVYRFYAVAFPMRARVTRVRTRTILLLCTWLLPIAMYSPYLFCQTYIQERKQCELNMNKQQFWNWIITLLVLLFAFPILVMLVLYPVIVVTLVKQKLPGNLSYDQSEIIRRRKRNIHLTKMFVTIIIALLLTYGTFQVYYVMYVFSLVSDTCFSRKVYFFVYPLPNMFHAINPTIYFIFCSPFRQGIKGIFSCCCRQSTVKRIPPGAAGEQIELENVPKE